MSGPHALTRRTQYPDTFSLLQKIKTVSNQWRAGYLIIRDRNPGVQSSRAYTQVQIGTNFYGLHEFGPADQTEREIETLIARDLLDSTHPTYAQQGRYIRLSTLEIFFNGEGHCCRTKICSCVLPAAPPEPTELDRYNEKLHAAMLREEQNLTGLRAQQRVLAAQIRRSKARLDSVDDFPKNARFIVVHQDGTRVYVNLFKDPDGVWHKDGYVVTWLEAYDVFTSENWGAEVEIVQVRPAKTIAGGKDFAGYGARPAAKKTAARKPAAKKTTKTTARRTRKAV